MSALPIWLTGKGMSSLTVRFQLPAADGTIGNGTSSSVDITGLVDEWDYNGEHTTQNVVAINSTRENEVVVEIDDSFVVTEIMRSYQNLNLLAALWYNADNADYCLFTVTRGGNTWQFLGVMLDYEEIPSKPKSVARLTIGMASIGASNTDPGNNTANPSYS